MHPSYTNIFCYIIHNSFTLSRTYHCLHLFFLVVFVKFLDHLLHPASPDRIPPHGYLLHLCSPRILRDDVIQSVFPQHPSCALERREALLYGGHPAARLSGWRGPPWAPQEDVLLMCRFYEGRSLPSLSGFRWHDGRCHFWMFLVQGYRRSVPSTWLCFP